MLKLLVYVRCCSAPCTDRAVWADCFHFSRFFNKQIQATTVAFWEGDPKTVSTVFKSQRLQLGSATPPQVALGFRRLKLWAFITLTLPAASQSCRPMSLCGLDQCKNTPFYEIAYRSISTYHVIVCNNTQKNPF